ncbi:MAG: hypothetical protein ACWGN7_07255 [Thermodesulfovibrionales bacterium]
MKANDIQEISCSNGLDPAENISTTLGLCSTDLTGDNDCET